MTHFIQSKKTAKSILIFIAFSVLSVFTSCSPNSKRTDLQAKNLKGLVKTITLTMFYTFDSTEKPIPGRTEIHRYDKNGYKTEELITAFLEDHTELYKTEFIRENGRKKAEVSTYEYPDSSHAFSTTTFEYDERGNIIQAVYYSDEKKEFYAKELFEYDANNRLIKETIYYENKLQRNNAYSYDPEGKILLKHEKEYHEDTVLYETDYNYNEKGDESESSSDGSLYEKYSYEYDSKGNWTRKTIYRENLPYRIYEAKIEYYE